MDLKIESDRIESVLQLTQNKELIEEKIEILQKDSFVKDFFSSNNPLIPLVESLTPEEKWVILSLLFLRQGPTLFNPKILPEINREDLDSLFPILLETEMFYTSIGGILGYHKRVIDEIASQKQGGSDSAVRFRQPVPVPLAKSSERERAVHEGIAHMKSCAEIYVVGGAGDRLDLRDPHTGEALPAAVLPFFGRSLLEGMIRDIQSREYLYRQCTGETIVTPILLMTSEEKRNNHFIRTILEENEWFGRPRESFFFLIQPLVPVITIEGYWSTQKPLRLTCKPGGHGVVWMLAERQGAFDWLNSWKRKKILVRQINNPVAGVDDGLLTFLGVGCAGDKDFGFAACPRRLHTAEGTDVLIEKKEKISYKYTLSNVEYVHFGVRGIEERSQEEGGEYSAYPANTNILFADIQAIEKALQKNPFPGLLVNTKKTAPFMDENGDKREVSAGRLESTMQNISDAFVIESDHILSDEEVQNLPVYLTYNERRKTISVTKNLFEKGGNLAETCDGAFRDCLANAWDLLTNYCHWEMPSVESEEEYRQSGPSFLFDYHPALGPLYTVISQKIRGGKMVKGSECRLEIASCDMENLLIDGSLRVVATDPLGLNPTNEEGKCTLHHVSVRNAGIDRSRAQYFWKGDISRKEELCILLHGNAEFYADHVAFDGDFLIEVPPGHRCIATQQPDGTVHFQMEPFKQSTWHWEYRNEQGKIRLEKKIRVLARQ